MISNSSAGGSSLQYDDFPLLLLGSTGLLLLDIRHLKILQGFRVMAIYSRLEPKLAWDCNRDDKFDFEYKSIGF